MAQSLTAHFHQLRANIELACLPQSPRSLVIASPTARIDTVPVVLGLARAFVAVGVDAVLADGDCQRPLLHESLECPVSPGLVQWLEHDAATPPLQTTDEEDIGLLAAGAAGIDPLEVLNLARARKIHATLAQRAELVIWRVPALDTSAAGVLLASQADATLLAIRPGRMRRGAVLRAKRQLEAAQTRLIGTVLLTGAPARGARSQPGA